jgi:hypothetical protein
VGGTGAVTFGTATAGTAGCVVVAFNTAPHSTALDIQNNTGTDLFRVGADGSALSRDTTDNTQSFQVQNAAGTSLFTIDSTNKRLIVGVGSTGETAGAILVLDSDSDANVVNGANTNTPTEVDGGMFYSSTNHSFECGESGVWVSCVGGLRTSATATSTVNTVTDTNFSGSGDQYTIPISDCVIGRVYRVTGYGSWNQPATTATNIILKLKFGATTISTYTQAIGTVAATNQWGINGLITCIDATHIEGQGNWFFYSGATTTAPTVTEIYNASTLAQVSSGTQVLTLSGSVSQITGAPTATLREFTVEAIGP